MSHPAPAVYVHFTEIHKNRVLQPWTLRRRLDGQWLLERPDEETPQPETGEVFVYYEDDSHFMKRHGIIRTPQVEANATDTKPPDARMMLIELKGDEMSAESREHYRVCTAANNLFIEFDSHKSCRLLDLSAMGFAVMSRRERQIGDLIPVTLSTGKGRYHGESSVQSTLQMTPKQWRIGVHCIASHVSGSRLLSELAQLSAAVQRDQLRRRSGAPPRKPTASRSKITRRAS